MKLGIGGDKVGYIKLPNGVFIETVGGMIDTTWGGQEGDITFYIPKLSGAAFVSNSSIRGVLEINDDIDFSSEGNADLSGIIANKMLTIECSTNINMTILEAKKAISINAEGSPVSEKCIGDILYHAYYENRNGVNFNFLGEGAGSETQINLYVLAQYNMSLSTLIAGITSNDGTVLLNA